MLEKLRYILQINKIGENLNTTWFSGVVTIEILIAKAQNVTIPQAYIPAFLIVTSMKIRTWIGQSINAKTISIANSSNAWFPTWLILTFL